MSMNHFQQMHVRLAAAVGALCSLLLASSSLSAQVLPYFGSLERDGAPFSGQVWMEVSLVRDVAGEPDPAGPCWGASPGDRECFTTGPFPVAIERGAFELEVGALCPGGAVAGETCAAAPLGEAEQWILGDPAVHLHLAVGEASGALTVLSGTHRIVNRQRIGFAVSDAAAVGFAVEGDLMVSGALRLTDENLADEPDAMSLDAAALLSWIGLPVTEMNTDVSYVRLTRSGAAEGRTSVGGSLTVGEGLSIQQTSVVSEDVRIIGSVIEPVDSLWDAPNGVDRSVCLLDRVFIPAGVTSTRECDIDRLPEDDQWRLGRSDPDIYCTMRCLWW